MRTGYLDALAARTLGQAPLLRPLTPSRFEPAAPTGRFDMLEVTAAGATASPTLARQEPDAAQTTPRATDPGAPATAEAALLGSVDPDQPPGDPRPTRDHPDEPAAQTPRRPDDAALPIGALVSPPAASSPHPADPLRPGSADPPRPGSADTARSSHVPPQAIGDVAAPGDAHAPDTVARAHPRPTPPPVVVRIGRIEVRAAQTQPGPAMTPRAQLVSAGRSLAEHLRARDRELS